MKKTEYLTSLHNELEKKNIPEADDIIAEYEQHFSFKTADGYTEEEISAKLGDPATLAAQYENGTKSTNGKASYGRKITVAVGLMFSDIFAGVFFVLLYAWELMMTVLSLTCAVIAACLFGGLNICSLLPPIPYWCGVIFALSFFAFAVFTAMCCIYFAAFIGQLIRSYGRFHHNTYAAASGKAVLPSLAINPRLSAKVNRRLRTVTLISLAVFAACTVLAMLVSMISSGAVEFWHAWNWFV
ncbi:MAG: DUF1700 domain-containing protein [Eubacteriales bacterium]|nr:DUF1700 domain-containing protein [Eubacteriales bacterium]